MKTVPKKKRAKKHTCFNKLNKVLGPFNTELSMVLSFDTKKNTLTLEPHFAVEKLDSKKRGKPKTVAFAYCPICGINLNKDSLL